MSIQDFIAQEKGKIQSRFEQFNKNGSTMTMQEEDYPGIDLGLIDSYIVTRVFPHFDAGGNVTKTDFWLLFKSAGYNNGWQYAHTIKVTGWSRTGTNSLNFTDDRGRKYHIEPVSDDVSWEYWQKYKSENASMFQEIDAELLAEHVEIAEGWK